MKEYSVRKVRAINDRGILGEIAQEDDGPNVRHAARVQPRRVKKHEQE